MRNGRSSGRRCLLRPGRPGKAAAPRNAAAAIIVDAIRYLVKEAPWRAMPADLPHWRTVYDVADGWHERGGREDAR